MQRNEGKAIAFNRRFGRRLPKDVRKRKIIGGEMRERAVIGAKMMDSVDSYCTKVLVTKEEAHVGTFLFSNITCHSRTTCLSLTPSVH